MLRSIAESSSSVRGELTCSTHPADRRTGQHASRDFWSGLLRHGCEPLRVLWLYWEYFDMVGEDRCFHKRLIRLRK